MKEPITITATVAAWLYSFNTPTDLLAAVESGNGQRVASMLTYYGAPDQERFGEHTRVGEADITLRLIPRDEQVQVAVQKLREKLDKLRAAYLTAQQEVLEQISKYEAIAYEVEA